MAEPEKVLQAGELDQIRLDWFTADGFESKTKQDALDIIIRLSNEIRYLTYWNAKYQAELTQSKVSGQ
jgi:hypothetical protein